jgi:hypothetical protein
LLLAGAAWVIRDKLHPALPRCTDSEVTRRVEELIYDESFPAQVQSIGGYREIEHDAVAGHRTGECKVRFAEGEITIRYVVEWQDREGGKAIVRTLSEGLPSCDDPRVVQILNKIITGVPVWSSVKSITGFSEISYDQAANRRTGRLVIHDDGADILGTYTIDFKNRELGQFWVQFTASEPPSCKNPRVMEIVEQLVKKSSAEMNVSLSNYRELRYARDARRRFGQCTATTTNGKRTVNFSVDLTDDGKLVVRPIDDKSPDA